eukprot:TRINITY_DN8458_c0_g1_i1.p1 TRINITY_DN8458_c0_g1~~TRINITY_DN8458_c0_g1_i1.p1  ORF type:complete len:681 (-),score=196.35 TRINITY_DN8458_c0_g1_i1:37-2079(-)
MASSAEDDADAVLSDVEEAEDPVPITLQTPSSDEFSSDQLRRILSDLDRERQARQAAESEKAELQSHFNRLKVYVHEAIKMRDENGRLRDDAVRERDETMRSSERLSGELVEARRAKDEILKQRDEIARQLEEAIRVKDSSRSEIESAAQMLVTGIEKISGKVSSFKNFSAGGLPRSQKYSGLPAIAYGVIKRTNEIVEELLKQVDMASKSRNDAREQMEHRNYEIAIEVSQLEATISGLKEQLEKKSLEAENLEKVVADKDTKISEMDRDISELRRVGEEFDEKLRDLELKMDSYRPLVIDQLNHMSKAQEQLYEIMKMVDVNVSDDQMDLSDSVFLSNEMDENLHASLEGMRSIHELLKIAVAKVRGEMEERSHEVKGLNETVARLVTEKHHIGSLLRSALSKKMASDPSSKTNDVLQVAENGLRDAGLDVRFSNGLGNVETVATHENQDAVENDQDEVYTLAGALEKIVRDSQLEIIDLQHSVEALRAELSLLKTHIEAQAKEISQRKHQIKELEEKERVANESVEGLMMDIAAAEEEIARWKLAAEQEAAAGRAVEQEFLAQLSALRQELEAAKQAMVESENKLKFKEETAVAAMAARDAAEKSLKLADLRSSRLRERLEELTRQLEESDNREDSENRNRPRYVCWPWQWLGLSLVGSQAEFHQSANEMELSEPLL